MEDESVEIDTDGVQQLVGRTIIAVERDSPSKESYPIYDQSLALTLDDGSVWDFRGWGYDASGLEIYRTMVMDNAPSKTPPPPDVIG